MGAVAEAAAAAAEQVGRDAAATLPDDESGLPAWLWASQLISHLTRQASSLSVN